VKVLGVRVPAVVTTFVTHPYLNPIHPWITFYLSLLFLRVMCSIKSQN
jgi:hypothetical protein